MKIQFELLICDLVNNFILFLGEKKGGRQVCPCHCFWKWLNLSTALSLQWNAEFQLKLLQITWLVKQQCLSNNFVSAINNFFIKNKSKMWINTVTIHICTYSTSYNYARDVIIRKQVFYAQYHKTNLCANFELPITPLKNNYTFDQNCICQWRHL